MEKGPGVTPYFEVKHELEIGARPGSVEKRGIHGSDLKEMRTDEPVKKDNRETERIKDKNRSNFWRFLRSRRRN